MLSFTEGNEGNKEGLDQRPFAFFATFC